MAFEVTVPPADWPVGLEELKRYLREDEALNDEQVEGVLRDVTGWMQRRLRRAFITQTICETFEPKLPSKGPLYGYFTTPSPDYMLNCLPVQQVLTVEVEQGDIYGGDWRALGAGTDYVADKAVGIVRVLSPVLQAAAGGGLTAYATGRVRVTYRAGYGDTPDLVPYEIRQAIKRGCAVLYDDPSRGHLNDVHLPDGFINYRV